MRLAARVFLLASALLSALAGCAAPVTEPDRVPPDFQSWKRTTTISLDYPIPGHEDHFRLIRMNGRGFEAMASTSAGRKRWDFPEGTVIAKEIYPSSRPRPGERPIQLTIMAKASKDPRAQGGWLWLTKDLPSGKETVFKGSFCVTCHANANERHPYGDGNPGEEFRDFVYFVPGETLPPSVTDAYEESY